MQGPFLRKYGVQTTINFHLFEIDGVDFRVDAADGGTDCSIMKDEGAEATCTNDFADEGTGYSLVLTATEMQAARIVVYVIDSATKVWLDTAIVVETYGNASAMHAVDLDDSVRAGLTALPNAAADAAGGVPISDAGGLDLDTKLANTNEVTVARMGALTDWINGGRLDLILDIIAADVVNIDGDAMRGTNSAALASVCTEARLAELAAANLPADVDTLLSRITAAVALASVCTEGRLAELDAAKIPADIDTLLTRVTAAVALASVCTEARLAELAAANLPTDIDGIKTVTDALTAAAAAKLALSAGTIVSGTVSHDNTAASTTVFYSDDITEATADHYKSRIVIFTSGALKDQATDIAAYALEAGEGKFTVTALTEAPADNVTFIII